MKKKIICLSTLVLLVTSMIFATRVGDRVAIDETFIGTTQEYAKNIYNYSKRKDIGTILLMVDKNQAFLVESGTRAMVIDTGITLTSKLLKVKILTGAYEGKIGWVQEHQTY